MKRGRVAGARQRALGAVPGTAAGLASRGGSDGRRETCADASPEPVWDRTRASAGRVRRGLGAGHPPTCVGFCACAAVPSLTGGL